MAKKYHPDTASESKQSEEKFKDISNAYDVLSDPDKKSQYDALRGSGRAHEETFTSDGRGPHRRERRSYESWHRPNDADYEDRGRDQYYD